MWASRCKRRSPAPWAGCSRATPPHGWQAAAHGGATLLPLSGLGAPGPCSRPRGVGAAGPCSCEAGTATQSCPEGRPPGGGFTRAEGHPTAELRHRKHVVCEAVREGRELHGIATQVLPLVSRSRAAYCIMQPTSPPALVRWPFRTSCCTRSTCAGARTVGVGLQGWSCIAVTWQTPRSGTQAMQATWGRWRQCVDAVCTWNFRDR
jgi:hypothetical protein